MGAVDSEGEGSGENGKLWSGPKEGKSSSVAESMSESGFNDCWDWAVSWEEAGAEGELSLAGTGTGTGTACVSASELELVSGSVLASVLASVSASVLG